MINQHPVLNILRRTVTLAIFTLVAACGGGGDDASAANDSTPGINPVVCILVFLATGGTACSNSSDAPPEISQAKLATPHWLSESAVQSHIEFEGGPDLGNANLPTFAIRKADGEKIGWSGVGSVNDLSDITDPYAFTPPQTSDYHIVLCPPVGSNCDGSGGLDSLTTFFRVLDQGGNVLQSSEANTLDGNAVVTRFDAGVMYYVTVDAGDTMGAVIDYQIFVVEAS
jgi:hypothetical protein